MAKNSRKVRYSQVSLKHRNVVLREIDYIVARAAQFDSRVVTLGQLVFFSTVSVSGDPWMLPVRSDASTALHMTEVHDASVRQCDAVRRGHLRLTQLILTAPLLADLEVEC